MQNSSRFNISQTRQKLQGGITFARTINDSFNRPSVPFRRASRAVSSMSSRDKTRRKSKAETPGCNVEIQTPKPKTQNPKPRLFANHAEQDETEYPDSKSLRIKFSLSYSYKFLALFRGFLPFLCIISFIHSPLLSRAPLTNSATIRFRWIWITSGP